MEFNKALLDCMQTLRRRLRDEQQLEIRLSQPDAMTAMLDACVASKDQRTRKLGEELTALSGIERLPAARTEEHKPSVRIYRGQRISA